MTLFFDLTSVLKHESKQGYEGNISCVMGVHVDLAGQVHLLYVA
jgi:hypothetical protein